MSMILSKPPYDKGEEGLRDWAGGIVAYLRHQHAMYDLLCGVVRDQEGHIVSRKCQLWERLEGEELRRYVGWERYMRLNKRLGNVPPTYEEIMAKRSPYWWRRLPPVRWSRLLAWPFRPRPPAGPYWWRRPVPDEFIEPPEEGQYLVVSVIWRSRLRWHCLVYRRTET